MITPQHEFLVFGVPIIGACSIAFAGVALLSYPNILEKAQLKVRALHKLTGASTQRLEVVAELKNPFDLAPDPVALRSLDFFLVYLNSRENLRLAVQATNECDGQAAAAKSLLRRVVQDHRKIRGLFFAVLFELSIGRLVPGWYPMYIDALLWTYSEEQELLRHLALHCKTEVETLILTRV